MWIYLINQLDMESAHFHSAYVDQEKAKSITEQLNKQEQEKYRAYNEWVVNGSDDEDCPEFGDYIYTYSKVWLDADNEI
jgi:hypothetical protein